MKGVKQNAFARALRTFGVRELRPGQRPVIEMRIFDFVMCAMDELVNQIAKIRYMFGGQAKPAVVGGDAQVHDVLLDPSAR